MTFKENVLRLYAMAFLIAVTKGVPPVEPRQLNSTEVAGVSSGRRATLIPSVLWMLLVFDFTSGFSPGSGFGVALYL